MDTAQVGEESVALYDQSELKICRLCCCEDQQELILIFPESCSVDSNKLLLRKIFECTTVQITSEGDDQNALICQLCVAKIDDFYAYREQCKANDDRIRQRIHNLPQICIKQEKDLHLDINISEPISTCEGGFQQEESSHPRLSSHSTTTANEFQSELENDSISKDADDSLLQPMSSVTHTDEITIKRETIEDDDVYYNSDGEVADVSLQSNQQSLPPTTSKKSKYRIIMAANNRERLVYQGYLYCRHSTRRDGSIHWRCRLGGCQVAVNLLLDETIVPANGNKHCHPKNMPEDLENGKDEIEDEDSSFMDMDASQDQFDEDDTTQEDTGTELEPVAVDADSLVIVTNKKKGETLVHLGYKYCKRYLKMDGSTFWKCRSNNNKCSAGVYVHPDNRVKYHGTHNHEKVVNEGQEQDAEPAVEEEGKQPYTIVEDVEEEDGAGAGEFPDDMAVLLNSSVEVMMPEDQKQIKKEFEITTNVKGRECLIYEGHQYSKDRERSDGAVLWRCRRNYDKCRSVAVVYKNGRVEKFGEHHHETDKRYLERQEQGLGSRYYRITKNQRGNDALVYEGNRFSKEWSRVDGSIIWRCSYKSGICRVKVVLNADGMVYRMGAEHEHDHEQTEAEVTEEYFDEDIEIVEDSLVTPTRSQTKTATQSPIQTPNFNTESPASGNYRIVKNRKGFEALVYDGYRYCKVRVKQDGSVKWLCKMNKKTCRAAVDLYPDGTIIKATDFEHNHERPTDMEAPEDEDDPEIPGQEVTYPIDPDVFGNSQWYYVKNSKNGMSMMHAGYRYTKKCDRVDGTSLWRCSASQRGCKAGVILFPNDTLAMVENAEHSHRPYEVMKAAEGEKEAGETQQPQSDVIEINEADESANESDMNMHSLLQTVLGGDEVPWMGGEADKEQLSETVWFNSATDRPYPKPTGPPDFKIIKNRRNTDSLVHRGYRYCKIRDRVDGSILWACQMNKKTCRASVNLTVDGRVEVINGKHNHQKTDFDDGEGPEQIVRSTEPTVDVEPTTDASSKAKYTGKPAKHPDYYYSLNKSNRECLIHKGYRFCKRSDRPDGSTTWRCSMGGNTCMVVVIIHADGTPEESSLKHNHHPLAELPPEIEREVKTKDDPVPETQNTTYNRKGDILEWNGFNYRKIKELPDSCIIWICQIDSCRVAVKMLPNGQLKMLSESEHNHTATGQLPTGSSSVAPNKPTTSGGSAAENKSRCYRLFKNQRGQMTLLYKGYRYSIRNRNQDGSSSWKCRANSSCRVIIYLMPDDRIVHGINNAEHNHEPNWESTKKLEAIAPTRVNPLYDYLNIVPGGNSKSDQQSEKQSHSSSQATKPSSSDSVNFGKNVIEHKGYYYRLVVRKKNGREYWRCVHFRNRTCRAALFCKDNGTIITSSNGKDHSHGKGAESRPSSISHSLSMNKQASISSKLLQTRSTVEPSPPDEVQLTARDDERYIDHGDYVIAKNRKDQNTLIFKDRRYYLSYSRSDGSAVWRCAHRKRYKCYAYVRLRPDGRLLSTGEQEHSHSLNTEENPPPSGAKETRNYKVVKNRVGNDILIHDSHRFRLNYQRNDGTTHWRCIWARSNHCSAGVYLFVNGVLKNAANEAAITHNHPPPSQMKKAVVKSEPQPAQQDQPQSKDETDKQNRTLIEDEGTTDFRFVEEGKSKTLICRGYRYWYTWVRKDGSIYYRCVENKKLQCPSGVVLMSNGKLAQASKDCHNHDPSRDEAEEEFLGFPAELQLADASQQEETLEQYPPLEVPQGGDTDFKIVKTSRGESLIYKGYRYWAKNRLANGIVSLCCTRKKMKKCPAMLRLLTNGRIMDPVGVGHTHPPNTEGGNPTDSAVQPMSAVPTLPKPVVKEPVKINVIPQTAKLPALSFNEESDDDAEQGDESLIGSRRYVFMKSSAQRNFIVFEGFVYDFEHKQHDGCVFYRCKSSDACPASLMLLSNGRVMNMDDSLHIHDKPDLSSLRQVGRGSKEFKIVQNKNGSNILVHRGHRYTTPRAKTDGAGIWYCHTYVPEINRRCYVPIELLPNGRVAPVGDKKHNHTAPFKTKQDAANDSKDNVVSTANTEQNNAVNDTTEKVDNKMLLLGGHRYTYAHKREDGAILWKCARKSCNASLYRLSDGHIVKGPEHNHEKLEALDTVKTFKRKYSDIESKPKSSSPVVRGGEIKPTLTPRVGHISGNPYIGQSIINDGYRYIYYLTRKDGSEHWRCCRRIPLKCRGGLYKQIDGTLSCSNDEGHTHPPDHTHLEDTIPMTYTRTELSPSPPNDTQDLGEAPEPSGDLQTSYVDDDGSYDYELIDVKGKKRGLYLIHKGAMFVGGYTRRDRARYYRCRTVGCRVAMLLHKNGLLVRCNEYTHDCQNAVKPDDVEKFEDDDDDNDEDDVEHEEQQPEPSSKKRHLESQDENEVSQLDPAVTVSNPDNEQVTNGSEPTVDEVVEVKQEPVDTF